MIRIFLVGVLCGVMMAAAVTFVFAIPANNDLWRVEITKRGGGSWYYDRNGRLGWMWTVEPIAERSHPTTVIAPRPRRSSESSRATRL